MQGGKIELIIHFAEELWSIEGYVDRTLTDSGGN
jgi:hypothetical protein